ncbi:hypothetical protein JCM11641_004225 [Rhodosporidiobolus odoratus]
MSIDPRLLLEKAASTSGSRNEPEQPEAEAEPEDPYADDEFAVERILNYKLVDNQIWGTPREEWEKQGLRWEVRYYVKWHGYDSPEDNTWEPRRNFTRWHDDYNKTLETLARRKEKTVQQLEEDAERRNTQWVKQQKEEAKKEAKRLTGSAVLRGPKKGKNRVKDYSFTTSASAPSSSSSHRIPAHIASSRKSRASRERNGEEYLYTPEFLEDMARHGNLPPDLKPLRRTPPPKRDPQGNIIASSSDDASSVSPELDQKPLPAISNPLAQPQPLASTSQITGHAPFAGEEEDEDDSPGAAGRTAELGYGGQGGLPPMTAGELRPMPTEGFAGSDDEVEAPRAALGGGQGNGGGMDEPMFDNPSTSAGGAAQASVMFAGSDDEEDEHDSRPSFSGSLADQSFNHESISVTGAAADAAAEAERLKHTTAGFAGSDDDEDDAQMADVSTGVEGVSLAPQGGFAGSESPEPDVQPGAGGDVDMTAPGDGTKGFAGSEDEEEEEEEEEEEVKPLVRKVSVSGVPDGFAGGSDSEDSDGASPAQPASAPSAPQQPPQPSARPSSHSQTSSRPASRQSSQLPLSRTPVQTPPAMSSDDASSSPEVLPKMRKKVDVAKENPKAAAEQQSRSMAEELGKRREEVGKRGAEKKPQQAQRTALLPPQKKPISIKVVPSASTSASKRAPPKPAPVQVQVDRYSVPPKKKKKKKLVAESAIEDEEADNTTLLQKPTLKPIETSLGPPIRKMSETVVSASTAAMPPSASRASPATSLGSSNPKPKKAYDPWNQGIAKLESKNGYAILNQAALESQRIAKRLARKDLSYPSGVITEAQKVRFVWRLGENALDGVADFDAVMRNDGTGKPRVAWVTDRPSDVNAGTERWAQRAQTDYFALQLVLSSIDGVKQADSLRAGVSAIFVHVSKMDDVGRSPGKLEELEHFRNPKDGKDIVFFAYGETVEGKRVFKRFWLSVVTITFTPDAIIRNPQQLTALLEKQPAVRNPRQGQRSNFSWVPMQYVLRGGRFGAPVDAHGNGLPIPKEGDLAKRAGKIALYARLMLDNVAIARPGPAVNASPQSFTGFPAPNDQIRFGSSAWSVLETNCPAKYCAIGVSELQKLVCVWRVGYPQIRRWIVIATPEELAACPASPGVDLVTLEDAEELLAELSHRRVA